MVYATAMEMIKKNITLILGLSIPILMILFVAVSIYLPRFFAPQPKIDFLYTDGGDYYYGGAPQYVVQNGKLVKNEVKIPDKGKYPYPPQPYVEPKLFVHNTAKNNNGEISFAEAQKLNLDSSVVSPDGFEVVYGSRGGGIFPFFFDSGTDYDAQYLKGHHVSKKLNVQSGGQRYGSPYNFRFLGWIKN